MVNRARGREGCVLGVEGGSVVEGEGRARDETCNRREL